MKKDEKIKENNIYNINGDNNNNINTVILEIIFISTIIKIRIGKGIRRK